MSSLFFRRKRSSNAASRSQSSSSSFLSSNQNSSSTHLSSKTYHEQDDSTESSFVKSSSSSLHLSQSSSTPTFQNCLTIDDALSSLYPPTLPLSTLYELTSCPSISSFNHSMTAENLAQPIPQRIPSYDWILDGGYDSESDSSDEDDNMSPINDDMEVNSESDQRAQFVTRNVKEEVMNDLLNQLELEKTPVNSLLDEEISKESDDDDDEDDEWGDFVGVEGDQQTISAISRNQSQDEWGDFVSAQEDHEIPHKIESKEHLQLVVKQEENNDNHKNHIEGEESPELEANENNSERNSVTSTDMNENRDAETEIIENSIIAGKKSQQLSLPTLEKNIEIDEEDVNQERTTEDTIRDEESLSFPNMSSLGGEDDIMSTASSSFRVLNQLALPSMETLEGRFTRRIMLDQMYFDELEDEDEDEDDDEDENSYTGSQNMDKSNSDLEQNEKKKEDYHEWWQKTDKKMEMDLPDEYFTDDYDPIPSLFEMFPEDDEYADDYLTQKLSEMDVIQKRIIKRLTRGVQSKFDLIVDGMKGAQEVDMEIAKAHMYASKARTHLKNARYGYQIDSSCEMINLIESREHLQLLSEMFTRCKGLLDEEKELLRGDTGKDDFVKVIERACALRTQAMEDPILKELDCLAGLRERSENVMLGLRDRIEKKWLSAFVKECSWYGRGFLSNEYELILQARSSLQPHLVNESSGLETLDMANSIASCILTTLQAEASRSFAISILQTLPSHFNIENLRDQIEKCSVDDKDNLQNLISNALDYAEFEMHAFESLCVSLIEILIVHHQMIQWHDTHNNKEKTIDEISGEDTAETIPHFEEENSKGTKNITPANSMDLIGVHLTQSRKVLWYECSKLLFTYLDHYLKSYQQKSEWDADLITLKNALKLVDTFLTLNGALCGEDCVDFNLADKFRDILKRYLRTVHVKAMNEMGEMLSKESWISMEVTIDDKGVKKGLRSVLEQFTPYLQPNFGDNNDDYRDEELKSYFERFNIALPSKRFQSFHQHDMAVTTDTSTMKDTEYLYSQLNLLCADNCSRLPIATHTSLQGLCKWTARLSAVLIKLPILVPDITIVFSNMYDLYLLTSLRLCMGDAISETIVLEGYDVSEKFIASLESNSYLENTPTARTGSIFFSPSRDKRKHRNKQQSTKIEKRISPNLEANICSPLISESESIRHLLNFTRRGQDSLAGIVNFDKVENWISDSATEEGAATTLEKRITAVQSCIFVAAILDSACLLLSENDHRNTGNGDSTEKSNYTAQIHPLEAYRISVVRITPILVSKCSLKASVRAILSKKVVSEILIIGDGWEESRLNEHHNLYIDDLCDRCAVLWFYLANSSRKFLLPKRVLHMVWENIVLAGFLSLLEGFSNIISCSTEGRALMSMDLATYSSEVSRRSVVERIENIFEDKMRHKKEMKIESPPSISLLRGMQYVDMYVKVFYFDMEDVIKWIKDNCKYYQMSHSLALGSSIVRGHEGSTKEEMIKMIQKIQAIYDNNIEAD